MPVPTHRVTCGLHTFIFNPRLAGAALIFFGAYCLGVSQAAARTLDEIIESHSFSICAAPDELPFSEKSPTASGFYIEIARKISDALGVELDVKWTRSREQIRFNKCDAIMGVALIDEADRGDETNKTATQARILTIPYITAFPVLVLPSKNRQIHTMEDLKNVHVAVPSGSIAHKLLNDNKVPVWVRFRNDKEIIDAILAGQADAGVVSQIGFGWYRKNNPDTELKEIDNILTDPELRFKVAIGLRQTNLDTADRVNEILRKLLNDGVMAKILEKYGIQY